MYIANFNFVNFAVLVVSVNSNFERESKRVLLYLPHVYIRDYTYVKVLST